MSLGQLWSGFESLQQYLPDFASFGGVGAGDNVCTQATLRLPTLLGIEFEQVYADTVQNYTFIPDPILAAAGGGPKDPLPNLNFCNLTVIYTHPGWDDHITVTTWLPLEGWNKRFLVTGGGGWVTGGDSLIQVSFIPAFLQGFAVSTTDGGHSTRFEDNGLELPWAHSSPGNINWPLFIDFAHVALHDVSVIGKALVTAFYGEKPQYSYFNGGSTGGRQGHMLAQRYPADFNGLLAIYPAMNWDQFMSSLVWGAFVMYRNNVFPQPCEVKAFTAAAVQACDKLDGVEDGIISMPGLCHFDPTASAGGDFDCDGKPRKLSVEVARVIKDIWEGPRSASGKWQWYGWPYDANIARPGVGAASTVCDGGERCIPVPLTIPVAWIKYYLKKDANFDWTTITHEEWDDLFHISENEYKSIIGTSDPDLTRFRRAGGKMMNWHGMVDDAIPVNGSVDYYDRVMQLDPDVHEYYRLYLAPGAGHSWGGGVLPDQDAMLQDLVDWVEKGIAPDQIRVSGTTPLGKHVKRIICSYPKVQHYVGGDDSQPGAFKCV